MMLCFLKALVEMLNHGKNTTANFAVSVVEDSLQGCCIRLDLFKLQPN